MLRTGSKLSFVQLVLRLTITASFFAVSIAVLDISIPYAKIPNSSNSIVT
jgi:hypothetical protein